MSNELAVHARRPAPTTRPLLPFAIRRRNTSMRLTPEGGGEQEEEGEPIIWDWKRFPLSLRPRMRGSEGGTLQLPVARAEDLEHAAAGVVILREAPNLLGLKVRIDWSVGGLLHGLHHPHDDTVDCLLLFVLRTLLLILLGWLAVQPLTANI